MSEARECVAGLDSSRGVRAVRDALAIIDARRETPFESLSFAYFVEWGIPLPEKQVVITVDGEFAATVDFLWRAQKVVGEADGAGKYRQASDLVEEKLRQEKVEEGGFRFVRWMPRDLQERPAEVRYRIERALGVR